MGELKKGRHKTSHDDFLYVAVVEPGTLEILVQEELSEIRSRKVFAKLSTEVLSIEDVVLALSEIIDDAANGYFRLPFISARSQGMDRLDAYTSLRRRRADKVYVVSNGKNTIYTLDYIMKAKRMYHDPVVYIIGPDASEIAAKTLRNLKSLLLPKTYSIRLNEKAINDFSVLTDSDKHTLTKKLEGVFEEAEIALKMVLLNGKKENVIGPSERKQLSKEILWDIKKQRTPLFAESFNPGDLIMFGIIFVSMVLLLIILTHI